MSRHWQYKKDQLGKEVKHSSGILEILADEPTSVFEKVISYGQCIFVDHLSDLDRDTEYTQTLNKLLICSKLVGFRDPLSYFRAIMTLGEVPLGCKALHLGLDAAFLNCHLLPPITRPHPEQISNGNIKIGIHFGRSNLRLQSFRLIFELLRYRKRIILSWIPWLVNPRSEYYRKRFTKFTTCEAPERTENIEEFYSAVSDYDVIITDTYHLCVIALSLGTRVICIGSGTQRFQGSLDDKKKEILFHQFSHSENYFFTENPFREINVGFINEWIFDPSVLSLN